MAGAVKGRDWLLKYDKLGTGITYTTIGGARSVQLSINNEPVDVTNADSAGIRTLLAGAGVTSITVTLSGVYMDAADAADIRTAALTNLHYGFKLTVPGSTADGSFTGNFMIQSFELKGEYNQTATYTLKLESDGAVAFA